MAKINNKNKYPLNKTPTLDGYVIGTAYDNLKKTRNYSIASLLHLLENNLSGLTQLMEFTYSDSGGSQPTGEFNIVSPSTINNSTSLLISKYDKAGRDLSEFFKLVGYNTDNFVLGFSRAGDPNKRAYFQLSNVVDEDTYYTLASTTFGESYVDFEEGVTYRMTLDACIREGGQNFDRFSFDGSTLSLMFEEETILSVDLSSVLYDDMSYTNETLTLSKGGEPQLTANIGEEEGVRKLTESDGVVRAEDDELVIVDGGRKDVVVPIELPTLNKNKKYKLVLFSQATIDKNFRIFGGEYTSGNTLRESQVVELFHDNATKEWIKISGMPLQQLI